MKEKIIDILQKTIKWSFQHFDKIIHDEVGGYIFLIVSILSFTVGIGFIPGIILSLLVTIFFAFFKEYYIDKAWQKEKPDNLDALFTINGGVKIMIAEIIVYLMFV